LSLEHKSDLHPRLSLTADGVSEFTFSSLYLFRNRYGYRVSRIPPDGGFIISGEQPTEARNAQGAQSKPGGKFFMTPCEAPPREMLESLFASHDYWKNISETVLESVRGITANEDRDNFDYLYPRVELAELKGKKYHKKKNLVNQFVHSYGYEEKTLTKDLVPPALEVLEQWREERSVSNREDPDGDYRAAREALERFDSLALRGRLYYAGGKPAAYCLGESVAKGKMFAIHFEKAVDGYKGIYQFMNQAFAASLPNFFTYINMEQDLGDAGMRQAKMSYRPSGFVKKYIARRIDEFGC